jgi:methyltransferase
MIDCLNLSVAIPDSCLSDEQTKRDKSIKIWQFARACSIFKVTRIYIYHDKTSHMKKEEAHLIKTILRYLDTPQYLRKTLYSKTSQLEYAGLLHPIKAPHHKERVDIKKIKSGDIRVGVIQNVNGRLFVEAGLDALIPYKGLGYTGKKINIKFVSPYPNLTAQDAGEEDIRNCYWGYKVKEVHSLCELFKSLQNKEILITSREGAFFKNKEDKLLQRLKSNNNLLVIFGSPKKGVEEILNSEGMNINEYEFVVNMFPFQGTETVRLEEAILGTLAILNHALSK